MVTDLNRGAVPGALGVVGTGPALADAVTANEEAAAAQAAVDAHLIADPGHLNGRKAGRALLDLDGDVGAVLDDDGDPRDGVADLDLGSGLGEGWRGHGGDGGDDGGSDDGFHDRGSLSGMCREGAATLSPSHFKSRS